MALRRASARVGSTLCELAELELEDLTSAPAFFQSWQPATRPALFLTPNFAGNKGPYFSLSAWQSAFLIRSSSRAISPSLTFDSKA